MLTAQQKNQRTGLWAGVVAVAMIGLAYASVPLYNLFCRVTGYGGTTNVAKAAPETVADQYITVRFNADVDRNMPWRFYPDQASVRVRLGEEVLVSYTAENLTSQPITGQASFNVLPEQTGYYFNKIQCFCFEEQTLAPHQKVSMPISFFVDPTILKNAETAQVQTIILSYTFFKSPKQPMQVSVAPATQ